jgi:two-component system, chemotaxis family, protein-glutamate methylesterase/glutaminase
VTPIRVLIADDAVVVRRLLTAVIDEDPALEVVGIAPNGAIAVTKVEQLQPDIITLDIEMPEMDGLQALAAIRKIDRRVPIIMFSTLTERGAAATLEALSLGASDYITKPANVGSISAAMDHVRRELLPRIKALCAARDEAGRRPVGASPSRRAPAQVAASRTAAIDVVAIGASTGGPVALATVLAALPADLRVPVVVTQHMPPVFTRLLGQRIDATAALRVREAADGDVLEPGLVLIAPGDFHMTFRRGAATVTARLDQSDPVNFCRPAVDVMFASLAEVFGGNVLAVMLTGMGHDGRDGTAALKQRGAVVVAQDEASSVVWGMPGAVVTAGLADAVVTIDQVGPLIARLVADHARLARSR